MPLLAGWTPVTVDLVPNRSGCQGVTGEMAQQHGYPSARRRRQLCPRHGHCRECRPHAASRSIGPMRVARPGRFAVLQSPKIALQTQSGDRIENRIKECQLDLFADRTSSATMQANQLRLWFASMAYVLLCGLRRIGLAHTQFAAATCGTIRLKLLKLGALVRVSVRRIKIAMASACPWQDAFALAHVRLRHATA